MGLSAQVQIDRLNGFYLKFQAVFLTTIILDSRITFLQNLNQIKLDN